MQIKVTYTFDNWTAAREFIKRAAPVADQVARVSLETDSCKPLSLTIGTVPGALPRTDGSKPR